MVTLTVENRESTPPTWRGIAAMREFALSILGAILQILATIAVVETLVPSVAGIYFRGVVIAYGLAALLRGKYELYIAQHFVDFEKSGLEDHARFVVRALGIRVLIRSSIACAVLLVLTTDLDVMDVYLRPFLQTYLPFVLAVPFAALALFLAATLRATNRRLSSVIVSSYSINLMIIIAAGAAASVWSDAELLTVSWGFFVGCVLAAGVGVFLTRHAFEASGNAPRLKLDSAQWRNICVSTSRYGLTGIALAALQWGPLCVLAVLGTTLEIAQYAVVTRTAQVIDFLIPAVIFIPHSARIQSRLSQSISSARGKLVVELLVSLTTTSTCVLAVAILTPWLVTWYGTTYSGLTVVFMLLFLNQWVNGAGRPAVRVLAADWDLTRIRRIMFSSMTAAIALSLIGIQKYGATAAAVGVLAGTVVLNIQALLSAFRRADVSPVAGQ